jgi:penicillin-binding protein 1B
MVWIKDELGKKIWKHQPEKCTVLSWSVASQVNRVLSILMQRMQKRFSSIWPNCETIGKTGTTNDARTCWFAGATPTHTTAVYLGRDDNQPLGHNVLASQTALPLWLSFTKQLPQKQLNFMHDPSLVEVVVHERTGKFLASPQHAQAITLLIDKHSLSR